MIPVKKITLPNAVKSDALAKIIATLNDGDKNPQALLVGGVVRNVLVGKSVHDIDIATKHKPEHVMKLLSDAGVQVIPTGLDHGTVTAVLEGQNFEITTLRRDVETDGRHAVVAFTENWEEDARRRDFTMNTLLCDLEGNIFDPTGQGLEDLEARRVVFVGDPAQRIAEDYLRILRFFRFYGTYGQGAADEKALQACAAAAVHVLDLSKERITQEFLKILAVHKPVDLLQLIQKNNVLTPLFHEGYKANTLAALVASQNEYDAADVIARMVVVGGFDPHYETVRDQYLMLSNKQKKHFQQLLDAVSNDAQSSENNKKIMIYQRGAMVAMQALFLKDAIQPTDDLKHFVDIVRTWRPPVFPLTGHDLKDVGVTQGPMIGEMLAKVEQWWMEHDFIPSRDECIEKLSTLINA
jgi:poly(A) polymerase